MYYKPFLIEAECVCGWVRKKGHASEYNYELCMFTRFGQYNTLVLYFPYIGKNTEQNFAMSSIGKVSVQLSTHAHAITNLLYATNNERIIYPSDKPCMLFYIYYTYSIGTQSLSVIHISLKLHFKLIILVGVFTYNTTNT